MKAIRTLVAVIFAFAYLGSPAVAAPPSTPPTLGSGTDFTMYEAFNGQIEHLEGLCQPGGTTFSFRASGIATGPYPGTFTEQGTVTFGPPSAGFLTTRVVAFESSFRIDATFAGSPAVVTGTKRLAFVGTGDCNDVPVGDPLLSQRIAIVPVSYEARIRTTRGVYFDRGTGQATVAEFFEPEDVTIGQKDFREIFISAIGPDAAKPGLGCGDENHEHIRSSECDMRMR